MFISGKRPVVVVADDQMEERLIVEHVLQDEFEVRAFAHGGEVVDYLGRGGEAELFLLDVMMPVMDGFALCQHLKRTPGVADVPVVFMTSLDTPIDEMHGLEIGAIDFIAKPLTPAVTLARVRNHVALALALRERQRRNDDLEILIAARTEEIRRQSAALQEAQRAVIHAQSATITAFCALAEARDNETGNHIRRTQSFVRLLALEVRRAHPELATLLTDANIELLYQSAPLHDIGKVAIPDRILLKPGALTADEWVIMRQHTLFGAEAIGAAETDMHCEGDSFLRFAREIALCHHEKWDGSGYPHGLAGKDIPLSARLMALADVYDALTTVRVYKPAFPHDKAVDIIREGRGQHFDPRVVDSFLRIEDRFAAIAREFADQKSPAA